MTGHAVQWENSLEVELHPRKRVWLSHFSQPLILAGDVTGFGSETTFNYICGSEPVLPTDLALYSFWFSCKDLFILNNVTGSWKGDCMASGQGTTGAGSAKRDVLGRDGYLQEPPCSHSRVSMGWSGTPGFADIVVQQCSHRGLALSRSAATLPSDIACSHLRSAAAVSQRFWSSLDARSSDKFC